MYACICIYIYIYLFIYLYVAVYMYVCICNYVNVPRNSNRLPSQELLVSLPVEAPNVIGVYRLPN